MKKRAGLWIDHRKAVIVMVTEEGEEIREIASHIEKRARGTGGTPSGDGPAEDVRDRRLGNQVNSYYDRVVTALRGADSIQIFGPGEAEGELEKRLEHEGLKGHVLPIETTDKMTDRQIAAKVRERFQT